MRPRKKIIIPFATELSLISMDNDNVSFQWAQLTNNHRQRRPFYYLTGCDLPDCYFAYDIASDRSTLWIPPVDPEYVMWAGMPLLPSEAMERYDVDAVLTSDELKSGQSLVQMHAEAEDRRHGYQRSLRPGDI